MPVTLDPPLIATRFATGSKDVDAVAARALAAGEAVLRAAHAPRDEQDVARARALVQAVHALVESSGRWPEGHGVRSALRLVVARLEPAGAALVQRAVLGALSLRHAVALSEVPSERLVATPQMQAAADAVHALGELKDRLKPV